MKTKLRFLLAGLTIMLFSGCVSSRSDKMPAGDIDMYRIYGNEIATLHNDTLRTDSKLKYAAALTLYKNVDFSFVRTLTELDKIFGAHDARLGDRNYEKQTIIFLYRYRGKRVRFVFTRYNSAIIHSECTDKIK